MSYTYLMTIEEARELGLIHNRIKNDELKTEGEG